MSTKNISRTPLEGGRYSYNKYERRKSSKYERIRANNIITGSHNDVDSIDDVVIPTRKKIQKEFQDKISPIERWMDDRVGKPWNKTYSLLKERFDPRTTAGRHIVYDHILKNVWLSSDHSYELVKYYRYYVDADGILRKNTSLREEYKKIAKHSSEEKIKIEEWLAYRMIGKIGNVLYWYNPTVKSHMRKFDWWTGKYNRTQTDGFMFVFEPRFIRNDRLSGADIEFFTKLLPHHKDVLLRGLT